MLNWILAFTFCYFILIRDANAADELSIVDVHRNITLSDDDPVYKDFYINGGEDRGLKKGLVITVVRKIQVRDASGAQSIGEIEIPVGQLRVISSFGKVSVAREYKYPSRDELPMLEQVGIMSGDRIDLKSSFIDNNFKPAKRKTSQVEQTSESKEVASSTSSSTSSGPASNNPSGTPANTSTSASLGNSNSASTNERKPSQDTGNAIMDQMLLEQQKDQSSPQPQEQSAQR